MKARSFRAVSSEHGAGAVRALALMTVVWTLLLLPALATAPMRPVATLGAYVVAVLFVLRRRHSGSREQRVRSCLAGGIGFASGWLGYPAWIFVSLVVGLALGLPVRAPAQPWAGPPWSWAIALLLAPVLEEILYRDRVLPALARWWGPLAGVLVSAALFAGPHLEPWTLLVTFELGLVAGVLRLVARSVAPCIGLHAGLNAASLTAGVSGAGLHPLAAAEAAAWGVALLLGALALARRRDSSLTPRPKPAPSQVPGGAPPCIARPL
jgi:membrane protease YdiL (CAAX protease family)